MWRAHGISAWATPRASSASAGSASAVGDRRPVAATIQPTDSSAMLIDAVGEFVRCRGAPSMTVDDASGFLQQRCSWLSVAEARCLAIGTIAAAGVVASESAVIVGGVTDPVMLAVTEGARALVAGWTGTPVDALLPATLSATPASSSRVMLPPGRVAQLLAMLPSAAATNGSLAVPSSTMGGQAVAVVEVSAAIPDVPGSVGCLSTRDGVTSSVLPVQPLGTVPPATTMDEPRAVPSSSARSPVAVGPAVAVVGVPRAAPAVGVSCASVGVVAPLPISSAPRDLFAVARRATDVSPSDAELFEDFDVDAFLSALSPSGARLVATSTSTDDVVGGTDSLDALPDEVSAVSALEIELRAPDDFPSVPAPSLHRFSARSGRDCHEDRRPSPFLASPRVCRDRSPRRRYGDSSRHRQDRRRRSPDRHRR